MNTKHFYAGLVVLCVTLWFTRGREVRIYTRPVTINASTNLHVEMGAGYYFSGEDAALIINQ